jgi:hypothetical protein
MRDYRNYLTTPIDLAGGFQKGYDTRKIRMAGETAATGNYRQAASEVMPYSPEAAKSYLGFADYEDQRTKRLDDERFTKDVIGPALAKNDPQATRSAASQAAGSGRIDMAATLYDLAGKTEDATLKREALVFSKMWSDIDAIDAAPPQQRQALYQSKLQEWANLGYPVTEQPREWGPNVSQGLRNRALGPSEAIKMAIEERKAGAIESNAVSASRRADAAELQAAAAWERANRSVEEGGVKLSTAVSIGQGYNDDIEKIQTGLGNLRSAIPYAEQVVRSNGKPDVPNRRSSDVALLRAASRAQTGPGVLTEGEVYGTLSPPIQQQLANFVAYTKIAESLSRDDRKALAEYVMLGAKTAAGDWYRRYDSATKPLANYGVSPEDVGIMGPEVIHPDDFASFLRMPESSFVAGEAYTGPSNRRYRYFGGGRWQYLGQNAYDPSLALDRAPPPRPPNVPANFRWDAASQTWVR